MTCMIPCSIRGGGGGGGGKSVRLGGDRIK